MFEKYEKRIYSQNGEDGITEHLIKTIYDVPKNKFYVEFGVENGMECNTRLLREKYGWKGLLMDGGIQNDDINLKQEFVTRENIVSLFKKYDVPTHINYLCVDIDSNDFYCLNEILQVHTADIIVCEYNGTHLPNEDKVVKYKSTFHWDGSNYYGTSLLAVTKLCNKYGYSLVYCDNRGVNAFFVKNELVRDDFVNVNNVDKLYKKPKFSIGPNGGHPEDFLKRTYITSDDALVCGDKYENEPIPDIKQNEQCKGNLTPDIKITYSIQVCNESRELFSLLRFLTTLRQSGDTIHVVVDSLHKTDKVERVLEYFKKHITIFERPFDTFKDNSTFHKKVAVGDYIFHIDADEMPQEFLMKNLRKIIAQSGAEIIWMPRMNIHPGLTEDFLRWSGFNVNNVGWINWPDYQGRIYKLCDSITWSDTMHSKLEGSDKRIQLPAESRFGMWHIKSMDKQLNRWDKDENDNFEVFHSPSNDNLYDQLM
jgi:hypothetical protein